LPSNPGGGVLNYTIIPKNDIPKAGVIDAGMRGIKRLVDRYIFSDSLPLEARTTNMVCAVGIAGVIFAIITRLIMRSSPMLILVLAGIVVSVSALLVFCNVYNKYKLGAWLVLFSLCDIMLPAALFAMGGVKSGSAAYFTMSIVLIFFLSKGGTRAVMLITHIAWVIVCYAASSAPPFNAFVVELGGTAQYIDHIQSFLVAGFFISAIVLFQNRIFLNEKAKMDTTLHVMHAMAVALLNLDLARPEDALRRGMGIIASGVGADRITVWVNKEIDGRLYFVHRLSGAAVSTDEGGVSDIVIEVADAVTAFAYEDYLPDWPEKLSAGKSLNLSQGEYSSHEQAMLSMFGVESTFIVPVIYHGDFWGTVTFDNCHDTRKYTPDEERIMIPGALLLSNAIIRNQMILDLTRAQNEAEAASRAKSEFLSNMSHEIRTPINAITGMTAIGRTAVNVERKDYAFEKINNASAHLLGVINDILDMSKIEANKLELSCGDFVFERVLKKVVDVNNFRVDEKRQRLIVRIDPAIPRVLTGDDQRLTQVITNLVSNAVKFTPEGGDISIDALAAGEENGIYTIQISVTDSGIGISPGQQARLFTSFQQAEAGTSRKFGGTGLGLAISKRIVEMMGGRIWVESEAGRGSTFAFTIRAKRGAEEVQSLLPPGMNPKDLKILVVDDDPDVLDYFMQIMEGLSIACDAAPGGEEAWEAIKRKGGVYDICFVDWKMPETDGVELTRRIKRGARGKSVVVMISSEDLSVIEDEGLRAGVDIFLPKPLFPSAVVDCINQCLGVNVNAAANASAGAEESGEADDFTGRRMLLAEDVEINREIVLALLEPTNLRIDCAENGAEAVKLFSGNPEGYDIIFMDLQMPKMDGYEASRRIRALGTPKAAAVPIVAMTANVFREDVEKCFAAGMNAHLGKPLDAGEMLAVLRNYLAPVRAG
jgi:signal transduction histidine kinase/CheY-like chemotaxis protein